LQESDSTFKYISPSIKSLLGYEQSEFIGKKAFNIIHKEDVDFLKKTVKERVSGNKITEAYTLRVRHKDGHFIWLESLTSPVFKKKKLNYFITSSRDVSQWMIAKQEIQEYQTSLQKLTTDISLIEEKQKKEIASNIHDHLSQFLVISKMRINKLKKNPELKGIHEDLKFIETHISEALENSRKITYELSPPVLYQLGIIEALNWLLEEVETTHKIKCKFNSNLTSIKLSDAASILLYRSIQEILNNTIKYANASLITVDFDKNKFGVDILIRDNGVGFNTSLLNNHNSHSGSGFGLFTVKERLRNIKGKFTITSKLGEGTNVAFFIPLSL
jgi:PAS domain S-box-containing protein